MSKKIHVGNLSLSSTEADLKDAFGRHGTVETVDVITNRNTGQPRGFAFVEMEEEGEADDAIEALDGSDLGGQSIQVNEVRTRPNSLGATRL